MAKRSSKTRLGANEPGSTKLWKRQKVTPTQFERTLAGSDAFWGHDLHADAHLDIYLHYDKISLGENIFKIFDRIFLEAPVDYV
ncbi:hypothetical protein CROQUDRAFT_85649 [Cronartium quercuum f. sp. fusiforme G11]|uniref:Uncharacterized protein n=1 Tax=Cronartium quercuum f. sp. fusiforme G11 TaxID=708437 RepID=A0A9P6P034_9BASI|nr:hypothetical protein CROQUDRAFT_85649 [Cronartium quercuum f. sp. fusiforme G11]